MKFEKKIFKDIDREIVEVNLRLTALKNARTTLSALCEHEWYGGGNDSHYDWEKCSICGTERSV